MRVLNASQMREADRHAIEGLGMPSVVLMENAGREVAAAVESLLQQNGGRHVCILAGRGNNGGDGFVVARLLAQRGYVVFTGLVGRVEDVGGDARTNLQILGRLGIDVREIATEDDWRECAPEILSADVVVDALFGTGLATPLRGLAVTIAETLNASDIPVVAVDLPSGLSADSCQVIGPCVAATVTVTFAAPKLPLVLAPAEALTGSLIVADIGIPDAILEQVDGPRVDFVLEHEAANRLPERESDSHKGTYGHVCVLAGSPGKSGAAYLGGVSALRSGAGLVTVATARSVQPIVAALAAEYMTLGLPDDESGCVDASAAGLVLAGGFNAIAIGPGIGTGVHQQRLVMALLDGSTVPLVFDADATTALAAVRPAFTVAAGRTVILTPHPGEMARLVGSTTADVQADRVGVARSYAVTHGVVVVLKGHRTLVAAPDGRVFINPTGNPGMATGGSGDVLTGAIAAWLPQREDPVDACVLAVYLHGLAGDLAARQVGETGLTAGDLVANLGSAALRLRAVLEGTDWPAEDDQQ